MVCLMPNKIETLKASTIENIDTGLFSWVDEVLNLSINTGSGHKKVPVLWLGAERAFQIKNDVLIRDTAGKLILPLITVNRESMTKDPAFKGGFQAHLPEIKGRKGGALVIKREINQEKTRNYKNALKSDLLKHPQETGPDRKDYKTRDVTIYNEYTMPIPTYVSIMYNIVLKTEYQQQMNELITPFIVYTGQINNFTFKSNGWTYEGFIQPDFTETKNLDNMAEEERTFETKVQVKVLGYLVGDPDNRDKPVVSKRETRIKVEIGSERAIIGDPFVKR